MVVFILQLCSLQLTDAARSANSSAARPIIKERQHFRSASVVTGMDDNMLTMAKVRSEELVREARQDRRATAARRAARTRQGAPAVTRGLAIRPAQWLAMAAARMRPTAMGR
jgi:hypothetical protein